LTQKSASGHAGASPKIAKQLAGYLALAPALGDDALLHNVLRCVMHVVGAGGAGLTLFDPRKQRLVFRAALGDGAEGIVGQEVPLKGSQHGLAFATGEVQAATPIYHKIESAARARFRNVLVAPMMVAGEGVGTLSAVNKKGADHFSREDMGAIRLFADLAAVVVRQRHREQLLRKDIFAAKPAGHGVSLAFSADDRELLKLFDALASLKEKQPQLIPKVRTFVEGMTD
jgi:GAF domain-containing protein